MKSEIGGYFELEISNRGSVYHDSALALNSGRNGFEHILITKGYKRIHIPYFTCDVILQPLKKLNVEHLFYHIDKSFKPLIKNYCSNDAILYTNYFGINHLNIEFLVKQYPNLIVDNAQAFFDKPIENVSTFYSPRKFFGLPDGGFVYGNTVPLDKKYEKDHSIDRFLHLLTRIENGAEFGYNLFKANEASLDNQPIKLMSNLTQKILNGVDFEDVIKKRLHNFNFVHQHLKHSNNLTSFIERALITCPLVYPYWIDNGKELRSLLQQNKLFTATYWPNILEWCKEDDIETHLTENLIPIPIDQRYGEVELSTFVKFLKK